LGRFDVVCDVGDGVTAACFGGVLGLADDRGGDMFGSGSDCVGVGFALAAGCSAVVGGHRVGSGYCPASAPSIPPTLK